jgi:hypothetical protein
MLNDKAWIGHSWQRRCELTEATVEEHSLGPVAEQSPKIADNLNSWQIDVLLATQLPQVIRVLVKASKISSTTQEH